MLPVLPNAQAASKLPLPTVCEEMVITSNYEFLVCFLFSPRHHIGVFFPFGKQQSVLLCGLGSRLIE